VAAGGEATGLPQGEEDFCDGVGDEFDKDVEARDGKSREADVSGVLPPLEDRPTESERVATKS